MMSSMTLKRECLHGLFDGHRWWDDQGAVFTCPGGRQATPEDAKQFLIAEGVLRFQERELCATCKFPPYAHEPTAAHAYSPWIQKVWVPIFGVPEAESA